MTERQAAIGIATLRTAVCAYRAATQSFVADEAYTYNLFVGGTWKALYFQYDANNHLLFSILAKFSMSIFGDSELALRLPSVLAGFALMLGVWRILERIDSRAVRWVGYVAISLHPLLLDFCTAARGYGLGTALLVWALFTAMTKRYKTSGLLLGLAISANLTVAFPAIGVVAGCLVLGDGDFRRRIRRAVAMGVMAVLPLILICAGVFPLIHGYLFYVGIPTIRDSIFNLMFSSIQTSPREGLFGTWLVAYNLAFRVLPVILLFIAAVTAWGWFKEKRQDLIPAFALATAGAAMVAAHAWFGVNYPIDRTGLSLVVLFGIAWALAAGQVPSQLSRGLNLLLGGLLAIQFATQFHTSYFEIWRYDRATKAIAREIERESQGKTPSSVSIGATWIHQPALEYYRVHDRFAALKPVQRLEATPITGQDYYVLNQQDKDFAASHDRTVLFSDPFAGVVLAK